MFFFKSPLHSLRKKKYFQRLLTSKLNRPRMCNLGLKFKVALRPLTHASMLWKPMRLEPEIQMLIKEIKYRMSPDKEGSIAKGLPIDMLHDFKIHFKGLFRIRYRGKTDYRKRYFRDPNHCIQRYATSFAIYPIESKWEQIYKTIIGEK